MNPTTATYPIISAIGTIGEIRLTRKGQQRPNVGDAMCVELTIALSTGGEWCILPDLQFGYRAKVLGGTLYDDWGTHVGAYRERTDHATGSTWARAFAAALERCQAELAPLLTLIEQRKHALDHAED